MEEPDGSIADPECAPFDINGDDNIGLFDVAQFRRTFTGGWTPG
jgi:hypothetical protein